LASRLAVSPGRIAASTKRAAVALILRVRGDVATPIHVADLLSGELDRRGCSVELFFILRASRAGDKWSGQVAFPGGKQEPDDTDDRATAARETLEEVGLNLESDSFSYLGRLDDRPVTGGGRVIPGFYMAPLIWLQRTSETPTISMQLSEVAAWRWVPLSMLLPSRIAFDAIQLDLLPILQQWLPWVSGVLTRATNFGLVLGKVGMPSICLNVSHDTHTSNSEAPFVLWGLTLRATSDALVLGGGPKRLLAWPPVRFQYAFPNAVIAALCAGYEVTHPKTHRLRASHLAALFAVMAGIVGAIRVGMCVLVRD